MRAVAEFDEMPVLLRDLFEASHVLFQISLERQARGEVVEPEDMPGRLAFECVMDSLKRGIPCPDWAAQAAVQRWEKFTRFEVNSLGEAFEIEDQKQLRARQNDRLYAAIYSAVKELKKNKIPLKGNKHRKGSLEIVGERFHMSASDVAKKMQEWRELCAGNGSDPDQEPQVANADGLVFPAFAEALSGWEVNSKKPEKK